MSKFLNSLLFLVSLLLLKFSSAQDESNNEMNSADDKNSDIFDQIQGFRIRSEMELKFLTEISDLTFLLFFYKSNSENSKKVAKHVKSVMDRIGKIAAVALIDCDNFVPNYYVPCKEYEYVRDSFPRLKLLIPPEKRYDAFTREIEGHTEYPWMDKDMTENSIYNFIANNLPDKAVKLRFDNIYGFLNNDLYNKVILFTDKKQTSLMWRGLTGYFYDKILFGEVFKTEGELIERFNITKFPTLLLYKVHDRFRLLDEPEIIKYEGLTHAEKIIEWIQPHALIEKIWILQKRGVYDTNIKEMARNIQLKNINRANFEEYLNKFSDKNVLLYFNTKNVVKQSVKEIMVNTHPFFISAFFNCDQDRQYCLEKFGVKVFPMLKMIPKGEILEERLKNIVTFNISKSKNVSLEEQIRKIFPNKVENLTTLEFPYRMADLKFDSKYVMLNFYTGEETTNPLPFDLLSTLPEINSIFTFITVKDPIPDIVNLYKLPKTTGIFALHLYKDNYKVVPISRESFYSSLFTIADNLIWIKNNYKGRVDFYSEEIPQMTTSTQFRKECLDHEYCAITFLDARPGEDRADKFFMDLIKIERAKKSSPRYDSVKFVWVNATCHKYLADKFEVTEFPGVTFYYRHRGTFATYKGLWEDYLVGEFFERSINDRYHTKEIARDDVFLNNYICELETEYKENQAAFNTSSTAQSDKDLEPIGESIENKSREDKSSVREEKIDL